VVRVPLGVSGGPVGGYAKIMAENTHKKKRFELKRQKQSHEVLVYKERLMSMLSLDPPTTSHIITLMLFLIDQKTFLRSNEERGYS
jgi:hypothetical protein